MKRMEKIFPPDLRVLAAFALLTVLFTYPLAFNIGTALPGLPPDTDVYIWNIEWVRHALFDLGTNPFFTHEMYYPSGVSLYYSSLILGNDLLLLPLQFAFGSLSAYMLTTLALFVLGGYAGYLFAFDLVRRRDLAFFAGMAITFAPYHLAHLSYSHFDLMPVLWLPLFALALKKLIDHPSLARFLLTLVFLFWVSITAWYYALYALIFLAIYAPYRALQARRLHPLREALLLSLCLAILLSPLLVPMIQERNLYPISFRGVEEANKFSADLLSFVTPSSAHPLWGKAIAPLAARFLGGFAERTLFLGYTTLALALVALVRRGRELFFWLCAGLIFLLLALGPTLHIGGATALGPNGESISLPYALAFQIPWVSSLLAVARSISRFGWMVMLCSVVLSAFGLKELTQRLGPRGNWVTLAACAVLGLEFIVSPVPLTPAQAPGPIRELAAQRESFATLDLPFTSKAGAEAMYFWTLDHKPTMNGYHARLLPFPYVDGVSSLRRLSNPPETGDIVIKPKPSPAQVLAAFNVRYVVLHKQAEERQYVREASDWIKNTLGVRTPSGEDAQVGVYPVPAASPPALIAALAQGWHEPERFPDNRVWRWMQNDARIFLYAQTPQAVTLRFESFSFARPRRLRVLLNETQVFGVQVPFDSIRPFEVPRLELHAGANEIRLLSLEPAEQPLTLGLGDDPRYLTIAFSQVAVETLTEPGK